MNVNYTYMRPLKAAKLKQWHDEELLWREELSYESFDNAQILPAKTNEELLFGLGGVLTEKGDYVSSSGIDNRFGGYYECECVQYKDQRVVYCGYLVNHWGHFLIEAVARMWYFIKNDTGIDKYIFVSALGGETDIDGNYREFFELLGVYDKLEVVNYPTRFREVIVAELGYKRSEYCSQEYRQVFDVVRERVLSTPKLMHTDAPNKVFLSRRFFTQSTEVGVDMLDDFFGRNDWYILCPERVSLTEMINLLHRAEVCAAESGTLPHNFLFVNNAKK